MMPQLSLLSTLFDCLPMGVVVLDAQGNVVIYNREEARLARRAKDRVIGSKFFRDVAPCMNVKELGLLFESKIGREPIDVSIDFSFPFPFLEQPRDVTVRMLSFDVDDRPHACLLIQDTSAERSMERMKETLTSLLVHDFKNPLSVIRSNLSFVSDDPQLQPRSDLAGALHDAERAASRLQAMVVGLLDINRLERGEMPLQRTLVDLRDLARQAAEQSQSLGRSRSIDISLEASQTPVPAELDAGLIRRALDNLIENAFRYSPRGGVVRVRAQASETGVCLEVADGGPGIPLLVRQQIFEKYVQVKKSDEAGSHNRGLGLTFVRLAARAHGGDATVTCPASGGSIFRIEIPTRR